MSQAKRKVIRAGRRGGKTVGVAIKAVLEFLAGKRVLYAVPTSDQLDRFWFEVKRALAEPLDAGLLYKNETEHIIEVPGTQNRIRAKTAWNADTLRGDYAELLILDEFQLMDEDSWGVVGAPMLLDNDGDAIFVYTPPSLHSKSVSKARDPRHAAKLFKQAQKDTTGRWQAFTFTSHDNPYISKEALAEIARDMSSMAYRQEIMAEDLDNIPGALWTRELIEKHRKEATPDLSRVIVGVDPPGGATECGIVVAGIARIDNQIHGYILDDRSLKASPDKWAKEVLKAIVDNKADMIVGEKNFGGDMVESTINQAAKVVHLSPRYKNVTATRGKAIRAEPVVALYEQGRIHHVGSFPQLEEEMCGWVPGETKESPNRLDAMVWALTELIVLSRAPAEIKWI